MLRAANALVALLHVYFLVLEMFLCSKPLGNRGKTARLAMHHGFRHTRRTSDGSRFYLCGEDHRRT
ncbi:MAG TPA: hypothetical protein VJR30_01320 [Bradyrhizobium sp.]|nr:hypothetical protein [Bradyrhizobium sp.]